MLLHQREPFDQLLQLKAPKSFAAALDRAAISRHQSRSDYIRTAVLDRLRGEGMSPPSAGDAA